MNDFQRLMEIVERAQSMPPDQVPAFLDDVCGDDDSFRAEVDHLLNAGRAAGDFLSPAERPTVTLSAATADVLASIPGVEVLSEIGRGAMGVVYKVRQLGLNRLAALKMIGGDGVAPESLLVRFQIEAEAIARLKHPRIVEVYSYGMHDGGPYLIMEYLVGGSLAKRLLNQRWEPRAAAALVADLADAVDHAHRSDVLHRDIKPANIIFDDDDVPHLADFGLARSWHSDSGRTLAGSPVGTPAYMAPEQAVGNLDAMCPATDVYGLGAVLYELLAGRPPNRKAAPVNGSRSPVVCDVVPLRQLNQKLPPALERICMKALSSDPGRRHPTAAALAAELRHFLDAPKRRMIAAAVGAAIVLTVAAAVFANRRHPPNENAVAPADRTAPLRDDRLVLRIWSPDGAKRGLRMGVDPGALPARPGDQLRAEVKLNLPAHVFLIAVDAQGEVVPLYPWHRDVDRLTQTIADSPPNVAPQTELTWPSAESIKGLSMDASSGQETILLLARRTPLPPDVRLADVFGPLPLPSVPLELDQTLVMRGADAGDLDGLLMLDQHRGFDRDLKSIDDPLERLLQRLRPHFELVRAIRFAHVGTNKK